MKNVTEKEYIAAKKLTEKLKTEYKQAEETIELYENRRRNFDSIQFKTNQLIKKHRLKSPTFIHDEERKITMFAAYNLGNGLVTGVAKCLPSDAYEKVIGEHIALMKALGIKEKEYKNVYEYICDEDGYVNGYLDKTPEDTFGIVDNVPSNRGKIDLRDLVKKTNDRVATKPIRPTF